MDGNCLFGAITVRTPDKNFIDRNPSYYEFANQTLNLTEAEVFAKFAPTEEK